MQEQELHPVITTKNIFPRRDQFDPDVNHQLDLAKNPDLNSAFVKASHIYSWLSHANLQDSNKLVALYLALVFELMEGFLGKPKIISFGQDSYSGVQLIVRDLLKGYLGLLLIEGRINNTIHPFEGILIVRERKNGLPKGR